VTTLTDFFRLSSSSSSSSSSSGASLTGHSRLPELTPLGTFLRTLPRLDCRRRKIWKVNTFRIIIMSNSHHRRDATRPTRHISVCDELVSGLKLSSHIPNMFRFQIFCRQHSKQWFSRCIFYRGRDSKLTGRRGKARQQMLKARQRKAKRMSRRCRN